MDILTLSHVFKSFGSNQIISDLSFSVPEHTIYGFIGPNGAGKTTTMKMILGLLPTDQGKITVHGEPVQYGQTKTNQYIGYLPDVPEFYGFMTPLEYLTLCGEITGVPLSDILSHALQLLDLVGLSHSGKRIHGFSRGMKQRLGIAQALLNDPMLLLCDEPTSALDPLGRKEILDIISSVKERTTVIFSTHILSDVEHICDEIAFLHNGNIALSGTLEAVKQMHQTSGFHIEFCRTKDVSLFLSGFPDGERVGTKELLYHSGTPADLNDAMDYILKNGILLRRIEMLKPTLESLYMEVIGE